MTIPELVAKLNLIEQLLLRQYPIPNQPRTCPIKLAVCEAFGVTPAQMDARARPAGIIPPRHLAMWLCRKLNPDGTLQNLAGAFNRVDHATILHAVRKIDRDLYGYHDEVDPAVQRIKEAVDKLLTTCV